MLRLGSSAATTDMIDGFKRCSALLYELVFIYVDPGSFNYSSVVGANVAIGRAAEHRCLFSKLHVLATITKDQNESKYCKLDKWKVKSAA